MIALTALILSATSQFGGGTVDALAKSLAEETGKNAVIVTANAIPKLDAFQYDTRGADALAISVNKGSHLRMAPGTDPIFSDRVYMGDHFREIAPRLPEGVTAAKAVPDGILKAGKVTLVTAGAQPISISSLAAVKWSRPFRADYMLNDLAVSASVKDMPERDFLDAIARAVGAFVTTDDAGYHMAYDGDQLRMRIVNTLKQESPGSPLELIDAKRDFYIATVSILPQEVLTPIFLKAGLEPRLDVLPNTDLAQAAIQYIKTIEALPSHAPGGGVIGGPPGGRGRRTGGGSNDILKEVDNRATVHLRMNASGEIILSVPIIQGRQSTYIDM